jgi:hypothetical protein
LSNQSDRDNFVSDEEIEIYLSKLFDQETLRRVLDYDLLTDEHKKEKNRRFYDAFIESLPYMEAICGVR